MTALSLTKHPVSPTRPTEPSPPFPTALATHAEWCAHWKALDHFHTTPADSPLHHDNRCEACVPWLQTIWGTPRSAINPRLKCVECEHPRPLHVLACIFNPDYDVTQGLPVNA